jgi:hypothetical protein
MNVGIVNVPDMEVWGQLACPRVKRKRKKKSCKSHMCPYVHVTLHTHDVYLYKSVKTSSCKERIVHVKYELLGQTICCWVGQNKHNQGENMCKHEKGSV